MTAYKFQPTWGPLVFSRQTRALTVLSARYLSLVHITWSELNWTRSPNTRKQMGTYKSHELEFENYVTPCAQFAVSVASQYEVGWSLLMLDYAHHQLTLGITGSTCLDQFSSVYVWTRLQNEKWPLQSALDSRLVDRWCHLVLWLVGNAVNR